MARAMRASARWARGIREMPALRAKLTLAVLIALFLGLQFSLWLGDFGLIRYWRLEERVDAQIQVNERLEARNRQLRAEVIDLKHGTDALEERARSRLGMIKKGEEFYQVVDEDDLPSKSAGRDGE